MPQFDTYSFFTQIFWVLSLFTILYASLAYYLLPAIATTLKVRKRKLSAQSSSAQIGSLTTSSSLEDKLGQVLLSTSSVNAGVLTEKISFDFSFLQNFLSVETPALGLKPDIYKLLNRFIATSFVFKNN
jgi:hypothetical protein